MKTCPGCSFLMDDDQEYCAHCAAESARTDPLNGTDLLNGTGPRNGTASAAPAELPSPMRLEGGGGTALLTAPMVAPMPETVRFRSGRRGVSPRILLVVVPLLAATVAVLGWAGHGPLAPQFARWGIVLSQPEMFPAQWVPVVDVSSSFEVEMPIGADDVFSELDPTEPAVSGGLVGERVESRSGASMQVAWTDFGLGPEGIAAFESPEGVRELAARYVDARLSGRQTVVRDAPVPEGHAVDTVLVEGDQGTSRARFVLAGDRLYTLVTTGPDSGTTELDAAHQRLLASFDPST